MMLVMCRRSWCFHLKMCQYGSTLCLLHRYCKTNRLLWDWLSRRIKKICLLWRCNPKRTCWARYGKKAAKAHRGNQPDPSIPAKRSELHSHPPQPTNSEIWTTKLQAGRCSKLNPTKNSKSVGVGDASPHLSLPQRMIFQFNVHALHL